MIAISNLGALSRPNYCKHFAILLTCAGVAGVAAPAGAFTVNAIYDSSITNNSNSATIIAAFNTAVAAYTSAFSNPVTVNIKVGWGNVGGQALPGGAAGASQTAITGYWNYAQMRSYLPASLNLPATQTGPAWFAMARAEGKALGLVAATSTTTDGAVGFNSSLNYDFNQADGIASGAYDFVGLAEHEIAEVLGRNSAVTGSSSFYQMPVDLFRYNAPGVQSYSYTAATYFSIDAGKTNLGWWSNDSGGGDRADWLTGSTGSYPNDVQNAYLYPGATSLAPADLILLGALGWNGTASNTASPSGVAVGSRSGTSELDIPTDAAEIETMDIPEPPTSAIMMLGLAGLALVRRSRVGA